MSQSLDEAKTILAKTLYLKINLDAIKEDPNYWESLSHKKQVELHKIKKELDEHFKEAENWCYKTEFLT